MPSNPANPFSIRLEDEFSYIDFFGEFSVEAGKRCVDEMIKAARENHRTRALLDLRKLSGKMTMADRFQLIEYGAKSAGSMAKIAFVTSEEVALPGKLIETMAFNRGIVLKIFFNPEDAKLWLLEKRSAKV
jgi:hypothetical protein